MYLNCWNAYPIYILAVFDPFFYVFVRNPGETGVALETFPTHCPYELVEVIDDEFLPEQDTDES
jgi:hypothetical protein